MTSADDLPPVRAECHAGDLVAMPSERENLLTALGIPHFQRLVITATDDPPPIRAERHAIDKASVATECLLTAVE